MTTVELLGFLNVGLAEAPIAADLLLFTLRMEQFIFLLEEGDLLFEVLNCLVFLLHSDILILQLGLVLFDLMR